jgi:hypothetical protein
LKLIASGKAVPTYPKLTLSNSGSTQRSGQDIMAALNTAIEEAQNFSTSVDEAADKIKQPLLAIIGDIESAKKTALSEIVTKTNEAKTIIEEKQSAALQTIVSRIGGLLGGFLRLAVSNDSADNPENINEADMGYSSDQHIAS